MVWRLDDHVAELELFAGPNRARMAVAGGLRWGRPSVKLSVLATCSGGACPTIYEQEDGELVVQGYRLPEAYGEVAVPAGEQLVRIPRSVLLDAAARLATPV